MAGLTWIMLAPKDLEMQARKLGLGVASCWRQDMSWRRPCLGLIFWANISAVDAATCCSNVAISGKRGCLVWLGTYLVKLFVSTVL